MDWANPSIAPVTKENSLCVLRSSERLARARRDFSDISHRMTRAGCRLMSLMVRAKLKPAVYMGTHGFDTSSAFELNKADCQARSRCYWGRRGISSLSLVRTYLKSWCKHLQQSVKSFKWKSIFAHKGILLQCKRLKIPRIPSDSLDRRTSHF